MRRPGALGVPFGGAVRGAGKGAIDGGVLGGMHSGDSCAAAVLGCCFSGG